MSALDSLMDSYPLLTSLSGLLLAVVGLWVWLRHLTWKQSIEPHGSPSARAWQSLAKAQGWKVLTSGPSTPFVRVQGELAEQEFELHIPTVDPPAPPTQVSVPVPLEWSTDQSGTVSGGGGCFRHRVPDAEPSLALLYRSFALFNAVIRQRLPHWDAPPGWANAAGQGVWPRIQREVGVLCVEASLHYTTEGLQTCIVAHCAFPGSAFHITHAAQGRGPKVPLGTRALDQLLHATGDPSPLRSLFQDPAAVEATLAVLHAYPGSRLVERGVVLLASGDLGEGLAPALEAVSVLAAHLDRLPSAVRPSWEIQ